ncbi:MAG: hypothetical protein ACI3Z7_04320 [Candidatus Aphodosoma sp.]
MNLALRTYQPSDAAGDYIVAQECLGEAWNCIEMEEKKMTPRNILDLTNRNEFRNWLMNDCGRLLDY